MADVLDRVPTDDEQRSAEQLLAQLSAEAAAGEPSGDGVTVELPAFAVQIMVDALRTVADGRAVTVVPVAAELTTQQAADLLNVSRPYLIKLLDGGEIAYHRTGNRRKIRLEDLLAYRQANRARRRAAADELTRLSQELDPNY